MQELPHLAIPHFQTGGLVLPEHTQSAVAILQPGND